MPNPTRDAPSAVDEILRFNQAFKPPRVRLKFERMDAGVFPFFRGTDHLFARRWPRFQLGDAGPPILICGDLHVDNFGAFRTDAGDFRYDINDFDEALIAPCGLDLVRCAASLLLAGEAWGWSISPALSLVDAFVAEYRTALGEPGADGPQLDSGSPLWDLLSATAASDPLALLSRCTEVDAKTTRRSIVASPDKFPRISQERVAELESAFQAFGVSRGGKPWRVLDATGRIAGIGSLGVRRYLVLVATVPTEVPRLLDVKECQPPALASCTSHPQPWPAGREAERVVAAQRCLQGQPAAGLDVLDMSGRTFRIRELIPDENRSRLEGLKDHPKRMRQAVAQIGRLVATAHVRGSRFATLNAEQPLRAWAGGTALEAVFASAARCVDLTTTDYAAFHEALHAGRFDSIMTGTAPGQV